MRSAPGLAAIALVMLCTVRPARADSYDVVVAGLGGEPSYVQQFTSDTQTLEKLFRQGGASDHVFVLTGNDSTKAKLTAVLQQVAREAKPSDEFILVLVGHGTDDGITYKFNLVGPDMTANEIAGLCNRIRAGEQILIDTSSASGGALAAFAAPNRAVITATKDGNEKNATVFARYFVEALQDPSADLNKDQAISGMEAFEYARRKVTEFYTSQKRLATEHASKENDRMLNEIVLVRFGEAQKEYADPAKHALITQKETLEREIDALNYRKDALSDDDYRNQMTALLLRLAQVQKELDQ